MADLIVVAVLLVGCLLAYKIGYDHNKNHSVALLIGLTSWLGVFVFAAADIRDYDGY